MPDVGERRAAEGRWIEADGTRDGGITRRRMIGYLVAAPTLVATAGWWPEGAAAAVPTTQVPDHYDLTDLLTQSTLATKDMISVTVNPDGTVSFELPRAEVGQGITTAIAILIADEMDLPLNRVKVTLADARPELLFNQFTGGSNTMHSMYEPVRTAAAAAREQMVQAAAKRWGEDAATLKTRDGVIISPTGKRATYGSLAKAAAVDRTITVRPQLKKLADLKLVGTEQKRIDGHAIVTGSKPFAMDLEVPGALPAMVCRPPTINGTALEILNASDVQAMPGVTNVVLIPHTAFVPGGVAVRAKTFGQCIDAVRALKVKWGPGSVEGKSDETVLADLKAAELPMSPPLPNGTVLEELFTFHFRPGDPLETNCAIADVRADKAEIWASLKSPIWAKQQIAQALGLPDDAVAVHVTEGGGSFGRHLFCDNAFEAAAISKAMGKPVKLMWHRTDNFRQGRAHPMYTSRVRVTHTDTEVLELHQRHTGVMTDFTQGLGEILTSMGAAQPGGNYLGFSVGVFNLTANVPYNFGAVTQALNEIYEYNTFNTSSVRNVYSPEVRAALELMVDKTAAAMGKDPLAFRREFSRHDRLTAVIDKAAEVGQWGRALPAGCAQGFAVHHEYKGFAAALVELDCRPETVNRQVEHAYTGPRVTKVTYVVDVGLPINILGLKAQMMGGIMDGIGQALSYGLHLKDGYFLEGSWDDAFYTRQWNTPPELEVVVMPPTTEDPGGAGEFGVAATMAAVACAHGRATGTMPTRFPLNHDGPLGFEPFPTVPPIPEPPSNGLARAGVKRRAKARSKSKSKTKKHH